MTILRLIRKWAVKFTLASEGTIKNIQASIAEPSTKPMSTYPEASDKGLPNRFADPTLCPPQHSPFETLFPGIEIDSPHLQYALQDAKTMIERIAQGHKIDDMMKTLGDIVRHSVTVVKDRKQKKPCYDGIEASDTTRHLDDSDPEMDKSCPSVECKHNFPESANLFFMYLSSIGRYLDTAMTRPGWAMSETGRTSLEALYEATQELLRVSGEAVTDTDDIVNEVAERTRNQTRQQSEEDSKTISAEEKDQVKDQVIDQWIKDIAKFLEQASDYVDALGRDRTMTKLVHALEKLRKDSLKLFGVGKEEVGERVDRYRTKNRHHARDQGTGKLNTYIQWLGWVLPRLLHLLPLGALPVPRIEIQTDNIECAIDARWIGGLALQNEGVQRYGIVNGLESDSHGQGETAVRESRIKQYNEGIGGKLVPDEILVKQWTEVKVSLSEGLGAAAVGVDDAQYRMGLTGGSNSENVPSVEATSRMKVCMDGIKACVRGLDYYFKYVLLQISWHNHSLI